MPYRVAKILDKKEPGTRYWCGRNRVENGYEILVFHPDPAQARLFTKLSSAMAARDRLAWDVSNRAEIVVLDSEGREVLINGEAYEA